MNSLKKYWPIPFKIKAGDFPSFIADLLLFILICAAAGFVIRLAAGLPLIGFILIPIGFLVNIYSLVGINLCILVFLGLVR